MTDDVRFSVLGPVRAWRGGTELDLGSPQQQAVLAVLLLRAGAPTSLDELSVTLWGDDPPRSAAGTARTYVYRLRRILEVDRTAPVLLRSVGGGYALDCGSPSVSADLFDFQRGVDSAAAALREGRTAAAGQALHAALALWTGPALAGVPGRFAERQRTRLTELRLTTLERRIETDLALGRHQEAIADLSTLVGEHPLRERLRVLLMTALARSGRRADALTVYREGHRLLSDELGVSPGPALQQTHREILADEPAGTGQLPPDPLTAPDTVWRMPVPAQLPADLHGFAGRAAELVDAERLLCGPGTPALHVTGIGGTGKTTFAVRLAHRLRERFPDGQLYVELRGSHARPAAPAAVLGAMLRALGVRAGDLPESRAERGALWRSMLHGRRILVVLDDALNPAQVRDLVPAAAGCAVIVTSQRRFLQASGAHQLTLGPLDRAAALSMLRTAVGADRFDREPIVARRLVEQAEAHPLTLHVLAHRVNARPAWPLSAFLTTDGGAMTTGSRTAAAAVAPITRAVDRLPADRSRGLRYLARLGTGPFTVATAADRLGLPERRAEEMLDALTDHHLLEPVAPQRYRIRPLVRLAATVGSPA